VRPRQLADRPGLAHGGDVRHREGPDQEGERGLQALSVRLRRGRRPRDAVAGGLVPVQRDGPRGKGAGRDHERQPGSERDVPPPVAATPAPDHAGERRDRVRPEGGPLRREGGGKLRRGHALPL
jgi:hypothetical protein